MMGGTAEASGAGSGGGVGDDDAVTDWLVAGVDDVSPEG